MLFAFQVVRVRRCCCCCCCCCCRITNARCVLLGLIRLLVQSADFRALFAPPPRGAVKAQLSVHRANPTRVRMLLLLLLLVCCCCSCGC